MATYITANGKIVIPAEVRRKFGMKKGTRVQVEVDEQTQRIILTPITRKYIQSLCGRYKGKGLLKTLKADKQREREL